MDIFMHNIDFSATQQDTILVLAKELHRPIFSPDDPLNFQVRLFQPGRRGTWKRNNGSGLLTLPSEEVGESFLQMYGGDVPQISVMLRTKQVKFRKSTRPQVSGATIYKICHSPYIDP
ncbi:hypothetical protein F5878DRAFT_504403, partial [Lentinula raphanica]